MADDRAMSDPMGGGVSPAPQHQRATPRACCGQVTMAGPSPGSPNGHKVGAHIMMADGWGRGGWYGGLIRRAVKLAE